MKSLKVILFILIVVNTPTLAQLDCDPLLKDIYHFNIGDEFTYRLTASSYDGVSGVSTDSVFFSFKVIDTLTIFGDTLKYLIEGEFPLTFMTHPFYISFLMNEGHIEIDTLLIIDSTSHNLNKCHESSFQFQVWDQTVDAEIYINNTDSLTYKEISGSFFIENYVAGLGLVWSIFEGFEYYYEMELARYIKDSDTTVIFASFDKDPTYVEIEIFPNPATDIITLVFGNNCELNSIRLIDSRGVMVYSQKLYNVRNTLDLDISSLKPGIYFVAIETKNRNVMKKLLKIR